MRQKDLLMLYWKKSGLDTTERIMNAFKEVNRENFILNESKAEAYQDYPLPIGFGQSISQPTTVMLMLKYLDVKDDNKVLEIGTGSGYNAALLSKLAKEVYTIERISEIAKFARMNLKKSLIGNVEVICADGSKGYSRKAPYDRIIVTAAIPEIPDILVKQLKVGGVLVAPVGPIHRQIMTRVEKTDKGIRVLELEDFMFVPIIGKYGFKESSDNPCRGSVC